MLFDITDIMAALPTILGKLVLIFVQRPVYFRFLGLIDGELRHPDGDTERIVLFGPCEYAVVH